MGNEDMLEGKIAGQWFKFSGRDTIYTVLLCLFAAGMAYLLWERSREWQVQLEQQTGVISDEHARMNSYFKSEHTAIEHSIESLKGSIDEQVWVSTLTPQQKADLNRRLDMPPSLRKKLSTHDDRIP